MCNPCRSSSLTDLAVHLDHIKPEIETVLMVARRLAEECTQQFRSNSMKSSISKIEVLSHQLFQVTKVKLKHCQGDVNNIK